MDMSRIPNKLQLRQDIIDFIQFEYETSVIWPWAISANRLLQDEDKLQKIVDAMQCNETGCYDTDDLYEAIEKIAGTNPLL